jgi:hypothetical protein
VNMEMGPALYKVFRDAGLPAPSIRLEMELGHDPDFTRWVSDSINSVRPQIERLNLSLEQLGDLCKKKSHLRTPLCPGLRWWELGAASL